MKKVAWHCFGLLLPNILLPQLHATVIVYFIYNNIDNL